VDTESRLFRAPADAADGRPFSRPTGAAGLSFASGPERETAMRRWTIVAAAAWLAPDAAQAEIPSSQLVFCAELRRVAAVAERGGDFDLLERSRAAPPRLGFAQGCQATGDENKQYWLCGQSFAPEAMARDALAGRIAQCLPEAVRAPPGPARDALFTLPYARIHVSETGGPGAHVGRVVELVVEAVPAP
jgi:hypothetical protein